MRLFQTEQDKGFEELCDEVGFILDLQLKIEAALENSGVSQVELARRLGVSEARVSQILNGNGKNFSARTLARIGHALGKTATFRFEDAKERLDQGSQPKPRVNWFELIMCQPNAWTVECNDNEAAFPGFEGEAPERKGRRSLVAA